MDLMKNLLETTAKPTLDDVKVGDTITIVRDGNNMTISFACEVTKVDAGEGTLSVKYQAIDDVEVDGVHITLKKDSSLAMQEKEISYTHAELKKFWRTKVNNQARVAIEINI